MTAAPLYPVQHFPPTLQARDGHELIASPLKREADCARCTRGRTIVGYRDRARRKTWPCCWTCATEAARGQAPPATGFERYDD